MYSYDRRAADLNDNSFDRLLTSIHTTAVAMQKQVDRFGGIENAFREGHGPTLQGQAYEMDSALRVFIRMLQRRMGRDF